MKPKLPKISWIKDWNHSEKKAKRFSCRCYDCYEELCSIIIQDARLGI